MCGVSQLFFSVWDLSRAVYRVGVELRPPLRLFDYSPGFHQQHGDPDAVELRECPVRVSFVAKSWGW
jgi:hypothetical protein